MSPWYRTNASNITFYLNTSLVNQSTAEANCNRHGGHLAAYTSPEEQQEVEQFFINGGWLFPKKHIHYWKGLRWGGLQARPGQTCSSAASHGQS